ncbi:MAG: YajG family lipoprotein [Candidatus Binatus sp.]
MFSDRFLRLFAFPLALGGMLIVGFVSLLIGCASEVKKLPITYIPQQNVQAIKGADAVPVEVTVEDLQPDEYGSTLESLKSNQTRFHVEDAAETVKEAAETELKARRFKIASGGALVTIQLYRFAGQSEIGGALGLTVTARGYFSMRVQVQPQNGKVLFSRNVGAEADPISGTPFTLGRHPVTHQLQETLAEALRGLFADPAFTAAILAARQPPPAKPAVSPVRTAAAYATRWRR